MSTSRIVRVAPYVLLALFAAVLLGAAFFKLRSGLYNALDFGIFNQVMWQTTHGHPFWMTIHPHTYLADHMSPFLLLLAPFYAIISRPETLIALQILAVASTPIPLLLLAKKHRWLSILGVVLWTINPYLHNALLYEFQLSLFAAPILAWSWYFFRRERLGAFWIAFLLLLSLREDMALTALVLPFIALCERRRWIWILPPAFAALTWFLASTNLSAALTPDGAYKFWTFYDWMGEGPREMLWFALTHPVDLLQHLLTPTFRQMMVLVLGQSLFVALAAPTALLLAIPTLLMVGLANQGVSETFLLTHYQTVVLTAVLIAWFSALPRIAKGYERLPTVLKTVALGVLGLLLIFPIIQTTVHSAIFVKTDTPDGLYRLPQRREVRAEGFLDELRTSNRVLAGSEYLAELGDREMLMAFHYAYIGKRQFSPLDFPLPNIDAALFSSDEIIRLLVIKELFPWAKEGIEGGSRHIREYLEREGLKPTRSLDDTVLFTKEGQLELFHLERDTVEAPLIGRVELKPCGEELCLSAETRHPAKSADVLLRFTLENEQGEEAWRAFYLPAYGLWSPREFERAKRIETTWKLAIPELKEGSYSAHLQMEPVAGQHVISRLGHAAFLPKEEPEILDERVVAEVLPSLE